MSSYLDLYRKKTRSTRCENSEKSNIITDAAGYTTVYHRRRNTNIDSNLIITNKNEGYGTAKIYTWAVDDLQVGDYFVWKDTYVFLVTDQENNVLLDERIHKFMARECNVIFRYGTQEQWDSHEELSQDAVFIGKSASKISNTLNTKGNTPHVDPTDESMLIFSGVSIDRFSSIRINDSQWSVIDWDRITAAPIIYTTIKEVPVTLDPIIPPVPPTPIVDVYRPGLIYEFETEDYYFDSNDINPIERKEDIISILIPYDVDSISFNTKKYEEIIEHNIIIGA